MMDKGWGVYVNGHFTYQVEADRQGAELLACAKHCTGMMGATVKEREATFRLRGVRVVKVTILANEPTSWPDGGKP